MLTISYWTGYRGADDGAIWKRGRNIPCVMEKMRGAVVAVEEWSLSWFSSYLCLNLAILYVVR